MPSAKRPSRPAATKRWGSTRTLIQISRQPFPDGVCPCRALRNGAESQTRAGHARSVWPALRRHPDHTRKTGRYGTADRIGDGTTDR
eukprot:3263304-Pyramimonas_sp.AAC.1